MEIFSLIKNGFETAFLLLIMLAKHKECGRNTM